MRRLIFALLAILLLPLSAAHAANSTVSAMTAASALDGTELLYCVQGVADRKCTAAQMRTYTSGVPVSSQTGANYPFASTDFGSLINLSNAANQAPTIAQAGTGGFTANWFVAACNTGAGTQTITPTTSTIGGASTYVLRAGSSAAPVCVFIISDGTNYQIMPFAAAAVGTSGATLPLLNGTNTWSGTQTFGTVDGTVTTQSGTTYTLTAADCGTMVRFTNASAVTVTIPQGLAVGCNIAIEQAGAGQVAVNGSAVTPATLHSAHSYTKTSAQWAIIGISIESTNVAILTGDGA